MNPIIREYRIGDKKEWLICHALVYLGSNERRLERDKPKYEGKSVEIVAVTGEKIVGFLDIELEKTLGAVCYGKTDGNGMLWDLGVLPEYRRKGIAIKLLDEGIRLAKQLGMKRLEAWSIEPNSWKLYEKYGFKKFFEYNHVVLSNREKLRAFDKGGMHVIEIYAHVMPETDLKTIVQEYEPKEVFPCYGFELAVQ
jgi:ribosomal protein S18 acetylase RimI-like enzyme